VLSCSILLFLNHPWEKYHISFAAFHVSFPWCWDHPMARGVSRNQILEGFFLGTCYSHHSFGKIRMLMKVFTSLSLPYIFGTRICFGLAVV
jgi:hypothetical protein